MLQTGATSSRIAALDFALGSIKREKRLPQQVFSGIWKGFFFSESDWLFDVSFVDVMQHLLLAEAAESCCIVNLTNTSTSEFAAAEAFYVEANTDAELYRLRLRTTARNNRKWPTSADKFVCSSDSGNWAVYCDQLEDISIFALRESAISDTYKATLSRIGGRRTSFYIGDVGDGSLALKLTGTWRSEIRRNYSV